MLVLFGGKKRCQQIFVAINTLLQQYVQQQYNRTGIRFSFNGYLWMKNCVNFVTNERLSQTQTYSTKSCSRFCLLKIWQFSIRITHTTTMKKCQSQKFNVCLKTAKKTHAGTQIQQLNFKYSFDWTFLSGEFIIFMNIKWISSYWVQYLIRIFL